MNSFGELDIHLKLPDLWQQEALHLLKQGGDVVVDAPTGAGKTYLVELISESRRDGQIVLAVPTRALANDKVREFRAKGWRVGIVTGDVTDDPGAPLVVATLETQKPLFLRGVGPRLFVIDEYQMIGDEARGVNYELCVALAPERTQLLMLSGSVSNPQDVVDWLRRLGRRADLVSLAKRPVPLEEIHLDALAQNPPRSVTGFWPRMVAKALMADLGPILVFAPRRKNAESLARQLAAALPVENALALSPEQKRLAGGVLEKLLAKRVAFHHSGLSYQQRAGLVEPLAKAGQLRIVVSTTGLAAGVNFSMRSVLVTEAEYTHGHAQYLIHSDELLQMFGRAGRRGLDTVGYALTAPDRPRLRDGRQRALRRTKVLDWPSLIGVLDAAVEQGKEPFAQAVEAVGRLFSEGSLSLGVERSLEAPRMACGLLVDAERARHAQPESIEILNSQGVWQARCEQTRRSLTEAKLIRKGGLVPALSDARYVSELGEGKAVKLLDREAWEGGFDLYGKSLALGFRVDKGEEAVSLSGWIREAFSRIGKEVKKRSSLSELGALDWDEAFGVGMFFGSKWKGKRLIGLFDLRVRKELLDTDVFGEVLVNPKTRKAYHAECQACPQHEICERELSAGNSPAFAWRRLGLIDARGEPTRRGKVFSFFQGGEGLAIAAALEERSYAVDAIAGDIANLRAGYRFDEYSQYSHRIARACRLAYKDRSFDGYLKHGLPLQYGDGAAEVIALWEESVGKGKKVLGENLRFGDVQRARQEWLSLLRHIVNSPDLEWERWRELQRCAGQILEINDRRLSFDDLPPLEPSQTGRMSHLLRFPRKW